MQQRWEWLAICSVVSIAGLVAFWVKFGGPVGAWASVEHAGMILCTIVALIAMFRRYPRKWPAGVALVCAAPMAQNILLGFPTTMQLVLHLGVSFMLFLVGAIGAVASAVAILVMKPPPAASDEVVAKARVVR